MSNDLTVAQTPMPDSIPAGVRDALSSIEIGGSIAPTNSAGYDGTSGVSRDDLQDWLRDIVAEANTSSGVRVTPSLAMSYAPVHYAISKIAGHLSVMSWSLRKRVGDRKTVEDRRHPAYRLLKYPSPVYPNSVFTDAVIGHAVFRGNGRAYIERDEFMRPLRMTIMHPDQCRTLLADGEKWHIADLQVDEYGTTRRYKIHDRDVLHIMGHSPDGIAGYDVYKMAKQSIGLGLGAEKQQSTHLGRNAIPGMILEVPPGQLRKESEARDYLKSVREMHEGLDNVGKTAMFRHGVTAKTLSHTGRDSQTIETRQFQREDTALFWCLETILGDESNSYNSHEQRVIAYLAGLPGKLMKRYEEQRDCKLLTERQKSNDSHFHKLNAGSLLRSDMKSTLETIGVGITHRIYSPNDGREILGLEPYEGGDAYENPNTSSGKGGGDDSSEANQLRERLITAYESRLADLFAVEQKRIDDAAAKFGGDRVRFAAWCDKFYSSGEWPKTFARVWESLGGDRDEAAAMIDARIADVRGLDPVAFADTLADRSDARALAEQLAGAIEKPATDEAEP
ncbi:phage portal protein [uncultured Maricaulis sp.]|uniref:phage portal protein n=1 Tax=uncultured Maricaulis sp. TaxID=174710 RepID=UPI0030DB3CA9|tara:strand:+ start:9112 stop:10803 length:1692 start_codon:yes stop_codon:yes gene_type:complete